MWGHGRQQILVVEPYGLVERVRVDGFAYQRQLCAEEGAACFGVRPTLVEDLGDQLAAVVPGREIGQIALDHLGRVLKLRLGKATSILRSGSSQSIDLRYHNAPVAPCMEVPTVRVQHLVDELELS